MQINTKELKEQYRIHYKLCREKSLAMIENAIIENVNQFIKMIRQNLNINTFNN